MKVHLAYLFDHIHTKIEGLLDTPWLIGLRIVLPLLCSVLSCSSSSSSSSKSRDKFEFESFSSRREEWDLLSWVESESIERNEIASSYVGGECNSVMVKFAQPCQSKDANFQKFD